MAGGPRTAWSVLRVAASGEVEVIKGQQAAAPDPAYLPDARPVQLSSGPNGGVVHAIVYPPASPAVTGPPGELPPFLVHVHGGPTSHSLPVLSLEKAFFTSRGIGIIDVNYGGSTGYGREYRNRLRGQWGIVDVARRVHRRPRPRGSPATPTGPGSASAAARPAAGRRSPR